MSGSDHKSIPATDSLEDEEDIEELDTLEEREESDELEELKDELVTTRELACDEAADTTEELVCTDELVAGLELLDDELNRDCKLDWEDDVASADELLDCDEEMV